MAAAEVRDRLWVAICDLRQKIARSQFRVGRELTQALRRRRQWKGSPTIPAAVSQPDLKGEGITTATRFRRRWDHTVRFESMSWYHSLFSLSIVGEVQASTPAAKMVAIPLLVSIVPFFFWQVLLRRLVFVGWAARVVRLGWGGLGTFWVFSAEFELGLFCNKSSFVLDFVKKRKRKKSFVFLDFLNY